MFAGLTELDRWLDDRMRTGLADPALARYSTWDDLAARLVDAQAGSLANRIRRLAGLVGASPDWHSDVLAELGLLHLLSQAGRRLGSLPGPLADAVATTVGWQVRQADVLGGVPDTDTWVVAARSDTREDRIEVRRHWLRGVASGRWALVLSFAAYRQSLDTSLTVGTAIAADLHRYPGPALRALVGARHGEVVDPARPPALDVVAACDEVGLLLAAEPWLDRVPFTVTASIAVVGDGFALDRRRRLAAVDRLRASGGDPAGGRRWRGGRRDVRVDTARRRPAHRSSQRPLDRHRPPSRRLLRERRMNATTHNSNPNTTFACRFGWGGPPELVRKRGDSAACRGSPVCVRIRVGRVTRIRTQTWLVGVVTTVSGSVSGSVSVAEQWRALVSVAMLGTDRRNPPEPGGLIADLVDDTVRSTPSERMLAQVAATVAVRRAGVLPGPPLASVAGPDVDDRPVCVPAAAERWHHVVSSWPVLEDEWMLTLLTHGWRVPPDLVPELLTRHRSDPIRRARAELACGPLARWLVGHLTEFAARGAASTQPDPPADAVAELPALPIPPDLEVLLHADPAAVARQLARAIDGGLLVHAHRAVLINLVARMRVDALDPVATALEGIDGGSLGFPLASVIADLARTRQRMLDELSVS